MTLSNTCGTRTFATQVHVKNCDLFIPNVFTPNNDKSNDSFYIRNIESHPAKLIISNRWGKEVYVSDSYMNDWTAEGCSDGVYFYLLTLHKDQTQYKGWVQVIR